MDTFLELDGSKSILNRLLIVQSFGVSLRLGRDSVCQDVLDMKKILELWSRGETDLFCGEGAAVLRFFALRISREPGRYFLRASARLWERPQQGLVSVLQSLGVVAELRGEGLFIESRGWDWEGEVTVPVDRSSQFLSAIALSSWGLPKKLELRLDPKSPCSYGYWKMTLSTLQRLGMCIEEGRGAVIIAAQQSPFWPDVDYPVELDVSSAFVLAAVGVVSRGVRIGGVREALSQPDFEFVSLLRKMGVPVCWDGSVLVVPQTVELSGLDVDLRNCPDLFPVLAVLCGLSEGKSRLFGATHLIYKESDRISKTQELLTGLGVCTQRVEGGLFIEGGAQKRGAFEFDCDQDHRMVFAAAVARAAGYEVVLEGGEAVGKSFPSFWSDFRKIVGSV